MNYLENKTAIITGISRGLGKALSLKLLENGVKVISWGITEPDYQHENLQFIQCDVRNPKDVLNAFNQTSTENIDFLINNAGLGIFKLIEEADFEEWQKVQQTNVDSMFLTSRLIVPRMKEQKFGHIVNISSIAGKVGVAYGSLYNSSKFAVRGFSESLFNELRKFGIKVSVIYPGSIATGFFDEIEGFSANEFMLTPKEVAESIANILNTSPNCLIRELEIRPLNSKPID